MKRSYDKTDVGVIVGRFQINQLHDAHIDLINTVINEHPKVLIFLGVAQTSMQRENALPYEARYQMILDQFPSVIIQPIEDTRDDVQWSKSLDNKIKSVLTPGQTVTMYGSRDSFIKHYSGKYKTQELEAESKVSATDIRCSISKNIRRTPDFRSGVIWAAYNQYPIVFATIDIVVRDKDNRILLGKKPGECKYRFPGGFTDPKDDSNEDSASRELKEETSINLPSAAFVYIGSANIDDWRYRNSINKIRTNLFYVENDDQVAKAGDDLDEVKWFDFESLTNDIFVDEHVKLFEMVKTYIINKQ